MRVDLPAAKAYPRAMEDEGYEVFAELSKRDHDEVGILIDAFNEMLAQIEARDEVLVEKNEVLALEIGERKEGQRGSNRPINNSCPPPGGQVWPRWPRMCCTTWAMYSIA